MTNDPKGTQILISDLDTGLPYSKGLMASQVMVTGLSPVRAYQVAEAVEERLRDLGVPSVSSDQLAELAIQVIGEHAGERYARNFQRWREVEALDVPLVVLIGGATGVGKSTIVNALLPGASARTASVSRAETGRHTTTHARLYRLDAASTLIDSPGMQQFGVQHIAPAELAACFVEFRPLLGQCRFNDCRHTDEPGCALAEALRRGHISAQRMDGYRRILRALSAARSSARRTEPARNREQEDDEEP